MIIARLLGQNVIGGALGEGEPMRDRGFIPGVLLTLVLASCGGMRPTDTGSDQDQLTTRQSELMPGDCGKSICPDATEPQETFGRWPNGQIFYALDPTGSPSWAQDIRNAMNDWENMTGGSGKTIKFVASKLASTPFAPVITIHPPTATSGGLCQGIDNCRNGQCDAYIDEGVAYHELGHCIAFQHAFNRYEAAHNTGRSPAGADGGTCGFYNFRSSIPTASNLFDFGPFDYLSTMMYGIPYPDIFRWDQSPMMPGGACSVAGGSIAPPSCVGAFCTPTCTTCVQTQPQGFPTSGDAAGTIELYLNLAQPGWRKFARTVAEDLGAGARTPFNYDLATGVTIPSASSPAISYQDLSGAGGAGGQPGFTTAVYVTGANGNVYTKSRSGANWSSWTSRSQPGGAGGAGGSTGTMSDPAAVSWGKQRIDLVATKGNAVFISTFQGSTWGTWQSLGQPPSVPPRLPL